ncbi:MAG TPA: hypothetical protein VML75_14050 [Kofleriaceae bacterium]|nr:hypothetical protein [Kofleriaceae bacterium]
MSKRSVVRLTHEEASRAFVLALSLVLTLGIPGCGSGAGIGHACELGADCADELQCLDGVCAPRCRAHLECGDGFVCEAGTCARVESEIGDPCDRELACGPGQACLLGTVDADANGLLDGSCQADRPGGATGSTCAGDLDCRNGTCSLGRCTELCVESSDCPPNTACVDQPRLLGTSAPLFRGCLQSEGTLSVELTAVTPLATVRLPVPSNARSIALVATINDDTQLVGAARVVSPSGTLLYATPFSQEEFYRNPLRHQPALGISTLVIPNTPAIALETGVYDVQVGSFFAAGGMGTAIPRITAVYKLDDAVTLDLHFHFLRLDDHPCPLASGLSAAAAQTDLGFQAYLDEVRRILATAGVLVGTITYGDITQPTERPDLDGLRAQDLPRLMRLGHRPTGINVFFTRSITPVGVQALSGGQPGPPSTPGTRASGIAVAMDTLCYRSFEELARITTHQLAQYMGLFRNKEPDGALDPILDSDDAPSNLMYFSEFGGTTLSPGQAQVLRLYPGLR